jgi:signal recognition particle GTPase
MDFSLGQFTLRDMYEQFQNIMKMGPVGQIMVCLFCLIEIYEENGVFQIGHDSRIWYRIYIKKW